METSLGERLERALFELNVTQKQLAKKAGVTQQTISYIVKNKIPESKLAPKLADALGINPNWLILGLGELTKNFGYEIPIINSYFVLQKFFRDGYRIYGEPFLVTEINLGKQAFAFQTDLDQVAICSLENSFNAKEFLLIEASKFQVLDSQQDNAYPIYEWRKRSVEY
ncbi:XRE family transcriptional regulator [Parashewanella curva]|uniref:XRE family transcriptional regulator n=1 Tax=Parashewanella curva TaxID=2338552 RepID=A0A3L8PTK1_9GAMM|nr:helix-turn-helix transcriptional regulator [Parashewanella curva]RLV57933.1 XRE family transcriptional regulator [Parashewanella curva]